MSGSDRACEYWRDDYHLDGVGELDLHHLYRAMAWLGEELPASDQADRTLAPRCIKDLIEERLFERRRDLLSALSVVFMDTTTLYFEGQGGQTLGQLGHSKDYRPHQKQMVVSVIMDQDGRPVCSEMWPGDTADVTTLIPVIDRLRQRFAIGRVCVVADRGMISAQTIASLEERGLEYILGVRERSSKEVQEVVLNDPAPSVSLVIPRRGRRDTELEAKEVRVGGRRYIVCRNLAEAKRDAEVREAVLRHLRSALRGGDKALVGNSAYRRYLKTPDEKLFEIDDNRVIEDARYDGLYVLRTNTTLNALAVMLRYRELLRVEDIFKTTKSILDTRPIYHKTDATIRGHVFCSFLALVVRKALDDRLAAAGVKPEWGRLLMDLDRLQDIEMEQDGKHFIVRTPVTGDVGRVFQAVGLALPPNTREAEAAFTRLIVPGRGRRGANDNIPMLNSLRKHSFLIESVEERLERLLHHKRQAIEASPHVGVAACKPHPHAARNGDHRRRLRFVVVRAAIIADAIDGSTAPAIRIRAPLANSISTTLLDGGAGNAPMGAAVGSGGAGPAGAIITAENVGLLSAVSCNERQSSCRHRNSWLV